MKKQKWHGEAILTEAELPEGAKKIIPNSAQLDGKGFIIAESETTGNHHCVKLQEGVSMYEKEGTVFIKVEKQDTEVYNSKGVLGNSGHKPINLEQGTWKLSHHLEYDPLTEMRRRVAD